MASYLDKSGLTTLWGKVKSYATNNFLSLGGGTLSGDLAATGIQVNGEWPSYRWATADGSTVFVLLQANPSDNSLSFHLKRGGSNVWDSNECYSLPSPDLNQTAIVSYNILTSKHAVTVAQGGTGSTTAAGARSALGITPANIGAAPIVHTHEGIYHEGGGSLTVAMNQTPIIWGRYNGITSWSLERNGSDTINCLSVHYYNSEGGWVTSGNILDHANFTTYVTPGAIGAPTLTGAGASGTWGINISGTATYATHDNFGVALHLHMKSGGILKQTDLNEAYGAARWYWIQEPTANYYGFVYGSMLTFGDNPYNQIVLGHHGDTIAPSLRWRTRVNNVWQPWSVALDNHNYNLFALPLSGGTMTGQLNLAPALQFPSMGTCGLNANNSDIIKVNGLYFADSAEDTAEGINFYRTASTWDNMTASAGIFYFGSNVGAETALTANASVRAGNFGVYSNEYPGFTINNSAGQRLVTLFQRSTTGDFANFTIRTYSAASTYAETTFGTNGYIYTTGLTLTDTGHAPLTIERSGTTYYASVRFKNSLGTLGYLGMTSVNGSLARLSADANTIYKLAEVRSWNGSTLALGTD